MSNDWPGDVKDQDTRHAGKAATLLRQIEDLQNSGDYGWASDTLEGIYTTVEETGHVTEPQQRAVDNIEEGGQRHEQRRGW